MDFKALIRLVVRFYAGQGIIYRLELDELYGVVRFVGTVRNKINL
jgi:hypothetical protein